MKTLLLIGDVADFDTYAKILRQRRFLRSTKLRMKTVDYASILRGELPEIATKDIILFLCFPFTYWDANIEPKNYKGVYGNKKFLIKFEKFWKVVEKSLAKHYKGHKLAYVNKPKNISIDRDKEKTKKLLRKGGILTPNSYSTRSAEDVVRMLDQGKKLFIKVRYGSMGKGITFVEKGLWSTNFRFRKGKLISKKSDKGWTFVKITNNRKFLQKLMKAEIVIEDAIDSLIIKRKKFDMRLYVYRDKVLYSYGRTNSSDSITTNISQGAKGERLSFVKSLPRKQVRMAKKSAVNAIKALGLEFGGVDIIFTRDKKKVFVLEVNAFPGLPRARRFNLSKLLLQGIARRYC